MNCFLAITTATPHIGVALGDGDAVVAELRMMHGRRHAEVLAPGIESLLTLSGKNLAELEWVAVDTGPGLFTGLRVGVATAKALASALEIPVVPSSSLDLLARALRHDGRPVVAVVDARRGEVFWAVYRDGLQVNEPTVSDPQALLDELDGGELVTGDGARRYADLFSARGIVVAPREYDHPRASTLLEMAASLPSLPAEKVAPTYLRGPDVRIGWEQRDG